jgi:hypothetical protein
MRTFSFILALAVVLAVPSMAGSSDSRLPGAGSFIYSGPPLGTFAAPTVVLASR